MMTHNEFAQDTKNIVNDLNNHYNNIQKNILKSNYTDKNESFKRMLVNRLYYALYNKLIIEFPEIYLDEEGKKHDRLLDVLKTYINNHTHPAKAAYDILKDLKQLRVWADYYPHQSQPFAFNINSLAWKVQNILNYKKIV